MSILKNKTFIVSAIVIIVLAILFVIAAAPMFSDTGFFEREYGSRTYKIYIPKSYGIMPMPMVVVLHGCSQSADIIAKQTKMNELAEDEGFIVLYPEQTREANGANCWNFFMPYNQTRDKGEPAEIVGMISEVLAEYRIDRTQIFATGLSAGGAMTSVLGATYPDVFRAIAVCSGLSYKSATNPQDAGMAMLGLGRNPEECGNDIYNAMAENAKVMPTLIFHGGKDDLVYPANAEHLVLSWGVANDYADDGEANGSFDTIPDEEIKNDVNNITYTEYIYNDSKGNPTIYKYIVDNMGHDWINNDNISQTKIIWNFFKSVSQ